MKGECVDSPPVLARPKFLRGDQVPIAAHSDLNARDKFGYTALMDAASKGHADCVNVLIDAHADLNATGKSGRTALMFAKDKPEIATALRAAGATRSSCLCD